MAVQIVLAIVLDIVTQDAMENVKMVVAILALMDAEHIVKGLVNIVLVEVVKIVQGIVEIVPEDVIKHALRNV